ncbi:hypothetical protein [Heyndrickxia oleronia]|uniref:hypothetical protein n=1 Tax=Heyndrickxia oleronia TaxID=38875 RepID=UPI001C0EDB46|nr:hypothetical protein [Heyndrickxia oleronia]MBU5214999.1 hypothetical protein [Heyndrickxia oleronia]
MNSQRKKRYWRLRGIRQERDYQSGNLQYANRPYTFRSVRLVFGIGVVRVQITTNQFIKKHKIKI